MTSQAHRLIRQYARIVEATRLYDISRSDAAFLRSTPGDPGEIIYAADTNIIQAFLEPFDERWRRSSRLFHNFELWEPSDREAASDPGALERSCASQATMLATECAVHLAGTSSKRQLLISKSHQEECQNQIGFLADEIRKNISAYPEKKREQARRVNSTARLPLDIERLRSEAGLWNGSLDFSLLSNEQKQGAWDRFITASLCRILAEDTVIEPYEQVKRLLNEELWSISRLEWHFDLQAHTDELEKETEFWAEQLRRELARRRRQPRGALEDEIPPEVAAQRRPFDRSDTALKADAHTIAFLSLASRYILRHNQRIVFLTADSLLLNAYRRWYGVHGESTPYLMRPLAIYGPQYNLELLGTKLPKKMPWFPGIRASLEALVFPLNPLLEKHYKTDQSGHRFSGVRARDLFCADVEANTLDGKISEQVLELASGEKLLSEHLDAIAIQLRWIERISIASAPKFVSKRIDAATRDAEAFLLRAEAEADSSGNSPIDSWLLGEITASISKGFEFSLPQVVNWLQSAARSEVQVAPRVGAMLRAELPFQDTDGNERQLSAAGWIEALAPLTADQAERALRNLTARPAEIFALASWVAFRQSLWSDALKFADLAARTVTKDSKPLEAECIFLKSVAIRIRMMSDEPTEQSVVDFWRIDLNGAVAALGHYVDHLEIPQHIRMIRALSERASVQLAYCAWVAVGDLGRLPTYRSERLDLREIFAPACRDLFDCAERLASLLAQISDGTLKLDEVQKRDLDWVATQVALGPECARIVYDCLTSKLDQYHQEAYLPRMAVRQRLDTLYRCPSNGFNSSLIVQVYSLSQRIRFSSSIQEARTLARQLVELGGSPDLALDARMLALLRRAASRLLEDDVAAERPVSGIWSDMVSEIFRVAPEAQSLSGAQSDAAGKMAAGTES